MNIGSIIGGIVGYLLIGFLFSGIRIGFVNDDYDYEEERKAFFSCALFYPLYFVKWIIQLLLYIFKLLFETIKYLFSSLFTV